MYSGTQILGIVLIVAGGLVTFVLARFGRRRSLELESGIKAGGLALAAAGALLILFL
ncbi:MAG: hypothetical protein HDQ87_05415 [Clostridia bacterium]|nr:hypothetical protein [Clostridia bacterium]